MLGKAVKGLGKVISFFLLIIWDAFVGVFKWILTKFIQIVIIFLLLGFLSHLFINSMTPKNVPLNKTNNTTITQTK